MRYRLWHGYVLVVAILFALSFFIPRDVAFPPVHTLQDSGKATLDIIDGMTKLIVTLNTAMLGAAATLTIKGTSWTSRWGQPESLLVVLVFVCGAVSYFGVYFGYIRVLTMVNASTVDPLETGLLWSLRLQYYGVIFGFFLLGLVFSRIIEGRLPSPGIKS